MHPMLTIAVRAARKAGNVIAKHYETYSELAAILCAVFPFFNIQ